MKILAKLLAAIAVLLILAYASIPFWAAYIVARELPVGWQLEQLDIQYPGLSGIKVKQLQLLGEAENSGISISLQNLYFNYNLEQLVASTLVLDINSQASAQTDINIEDLTLPVFTVPENIPDLQIETIHINLKQDAQTRLKVLLSEFQLAADTEREYLVRSGVKLGQTDKLSGQLSGKISPQSTHAKLEMLATNNTSAWLNISFMQQASNNFSTLKMGFNSDLADKAWLGSALTYASDKQLSYIDGQFSAEARFAGADAQKIESLLFNSEQLDITLDNLDLKINASLAIGREASGLTVKLLRAAEITYHDKAGEIFRGLNKIPGLRLIQEDLDGIVLAVISSDSTMDFSSKANNSISFAGEIELSLDTANTAIKLSATSLAADIDQQLTPESVNADGLFNLDWKQSSAFEYRTDEIKLNAGSLSLTTQGLLELEGLNLNLPKPLAIAAELENMQIEIISPADTTTISADITSLGAELFMLNKQFITTGKATVVNAYVMPLGFSSTKTELDWDALNLADLTGNINSRTEGFNAQIETVNWSGFDFDLEYQLLENSALNGSGKILLSSGPHIPIIFTGNTETASWDIRVQETSIAAQKLFGIFNLLKIEIPTELKFNQGQLSIEGDIQIGKEITTNLNIQGTDIGLSVLKTSLAGGNFSAQLNYTDTLNASSEFLLEQLSLAAGLTLTQVSADMSMHNADQITLSQLSANLFSGKLHSDKLQILDTEKVISVLKFTQLDLQQLLEFADFDGLSGSGKLNIKLPVNNDGIGLVVEDGSFESSGLGYLSYFQAGIPSSNIGLQALENFQYQKLSGSIEYKSDGSYKVVVKLEGSNPDLYNGYPIVFTLTLNGTLPELFDALFISGNFEDAILKQVQSDKIQNEPSAAIQ